MQSLRAIIKKYTTFQVLISIEHISETDILKI